MTSRHLCSDSTQRLTKDEATMRNDRDSSLWCEVTDDTNRKNRITLYSHSYHTRRLLPNRHHEKSCFFFFANVSRRFLFFGSEVSKPLLKNLHLLFLHFSRFQRFRCSTVGIFVATSTVLQVWTLSDVLSLCCGRDFDHVIWGADKLWRYLTAYFLILKVYIKLYVRTTNIAHHIRIEIYRNLNMNLFFFFSHLLLFFFFKHNKLLTRKLKKKEFPRVFLPPITEQLYSWLLYLIHTYVLNVFHLWNFLTSVSVSVAGGRKIEN